MLLLLPTIIGICAFLIVYGFSPLDVQNDNWIMAGYDEMDIPQYYAGWLAFRNSEWNFPIGLAEDMACEDGTYVSYTDSIPWVAIFFKCLRGVLPTTFQYFGIFALLCYVLQSIASFKIIYLKTADTIYSLLGTILFSFAPIFWNAP